ncbi:MAG: sulfite exporter TauE/SafE family protein [Solirubrobacteraceae bacterium]
MDPWIIVFGLGVGVLIGMTGVGGGSLMTPLLILVFGIAPVTAIGTDLAYGAVTKTVGGWRHLRQGTVDLALAGWMAVGSVPAAIVGVVALKALQRGSGPGFDDTVLTAVGGALILGGAALLARLLLGGTAGEREHAELRGRRRAVAVVLGAVIGFVLGVTSAGSGALISVALILVFDLMPRRVVGTGVFHAAILLWAAALAHLVAGDIDYALAGTILLGSVPGVWIGSWLAMRVPVGALRTTLGVLLLGSGLALIQKGGVGIPSGVIAAFPAAVLAIICSAQVRARARRSQARAAAPTA